MLRRSTILEARFPDAPEFAQVRQVLGDAVINQMLRLVWTAWDHLRENIIEHIDLSGSDDQLERSLTEQLETAIQDRLTRNEAYSVQHESWEMESRQGGRARPPQYDIAFIMRAHPRVKWPIEAKVLSAADRIDGYMDDINAMISCYYAPFTGEGAVVGFLRNGHTEAAFRAIADEIRPIQLHTFAPFLERPHRISSHNRRVPDGKLYPNQLRCHHLLMHLSVEPASDG